MNLVGDLSNIFKKVLLNLQKLFTEMVHSEEKSLTPDKKIAEMTLYNSKNAFGEQQDMSECLDSFFDLIGATMKGESKEELWRYLTISLCHFRVLYLSATKDYFSGKYGSFYFSIKMGSLKRV